MRRPDARLRALEASVNSIHRRGEDRDLTPVEMRLCEEMAARRGVPLEAVVAAKRRVIRNPLPREVVMANLEARAQSEGKTVDQLIAEAAARIERARREVESLPDSKN